MLVKKYCWIYSSDWRPQILPPRAICWPALIYNMKFRRDTLLTALWMWQMASWEVSESCNDQIAMFTTKQQNEYNDYTLITNLMHWLLLIHKILFSSTCFEHQVLIFRRTWLYTCSIWYRHSLYNSSWWTVDTQPQCVLTGHQDSYREWRYHMLHVYNHVLLKMSTWCLKHVEENSILWINSNQCIKLVINV